MHKFIDFAFITLKKSEVSGSDREQRWERQDRINSRDSNLILAEFSTDMLTCTNAGQHTRDSMWSATRNKCFSKEVKMAMNENMLLSTLLYRCELDMSRK